MVATDFFGYYRPTECGLRVWLREKGEEESPPGPFSELLMRLGQEHEARHLASFPAHLDLGVGSIADRVERTCEAVAAGTHMIYQGALRAEARLAGSEVEIVGVPDFMLPTNYGYGIRDSKLARRIGNSHPEIRLQLELYGWLYERSFGEAPASLQIYNGAGEILVLPYEGGGDALAVLERILLIREQAEQPELVVGWSKCSGCGYFERCWPEAEEKRSVGLVPGVDLGLTRELRARGIDTIQQMQEHFDPETLAGLERPWGKRRVKVGEATSRRILDNAQALTAKHPILLSAPAIPEHPNYAMFDLEGMPPHLDELEKVYIWGLQVFGEDPGPFLAATSGFAPYGDREGWESFLGNAEEIFDRHGDVPFVHWATYERTKLDLYLGRYGDRRGVADRVKNNLLDLLPVAQESVALPVPSYGLKQVEQIAGFQRTLDEYGGDWSIARYIEATETHNQTLRTEIMEEILAYNREDLEATWAILLWLQGLRPAA